MYGVLLSAGKRAADSKKYKLAAAIVVTIIVTFVVTIVVASVVTVVVPVFAASAASAAIAWMPVAAIRCFIKPGNNNTRVIAAAGGEIEVAHSEYTKGSKVIAAHNDPPNHQFR